MSLNTVSFFKSAQARKHPLGNPPILDIEGEGQGNVKEEKDKNSDVNGEGVQVQVLGLGLGVGQGAGVRNSYRHSSAREGPNSMKSKEKEKDREKERERGEVGKSPGSQSGMPAEPYTMDSYVDFVKNNYISGDASVLMFGATASRQVSLSVCPSVCLLFTAFNQWVNMVGGLDVHKKSEMRWHNVIGHERTTYAKITSNRIGSDQYISTPSSYSNCPTACAVLKPYSTYSLLYPAIERHSSGQGVEDVLHGAF